MTIDASQLKVSVQEQERWRRVMSVTVPASVVQKEEQKAAKQLASRARMKGFRKGRVPTKLVESRYAGTLRREALDKLIASAYREALAVEQLRPISEGEIEDIQYQPAQDLTFAIAFDVEPTIHVGRVGGFVVERTVRPVTDEQIERVLARVQEQNGVWRPEEAGKPADADLVSVNILKLDAEGAPEGEGRDYDFILGQGDAIPDIEAAIKTLEIGDVGDFDVTFPPDFPDESRRGEVERVRIALVSRRVLEVPALDDDLARQVGDFESLESLTVKIRTDMEREASESADAAVRSRLLDLLIEANPFEVPKSMVDRYASAVLGDQGIPEDRRGELFERIRPEAERAVKRLLMVDRLAETQGLTTTDEELDTRVEQIAAANDTTPAKVYAELQKSGRLESVERELTEKKVFDFLRDQSEIIDAAAE